ncbi:MAG TPA: hypothetical protein VG125_27850 [Pirellulales bacterium]|jgi:hypothetical protein|nr:hypothetical protein [Pirellulales bacterium]
MLTPAEELGLSGLNLESRLRKVFYGLSDETIVELTRQMDREAFRRNLIYSRHGEVEAIRVMLRPIGVMPDQLAYLHFVSLTILNALKRLPDLYVQDFEVRKLVPLSEAEERWLWDSWGPSQRDNNPVFGRLDAMVEFTSPTWKESLRFFEPNLCGVGGIHLGPTCEQMLTDVVLPVVAKSDPKINMEVGQDLRELFIQEVIDHLETIGRTGRNVCFIEPKYSGDGPCEQEPLAEYFHRRHGMTITHADPAELVLEKGEVFYEGTPVDIAYRDYEVRDLLALEARGVDLTPVRRLFVENRMVSSIGGDFDHKSCWEILTDPVLSQKYFNADERQVFRRHVLWTRLLGDRQTCLPHGETGRLLDYVRREHERLVLKPNRSYGGDRVYIGHGMTQAEWDTAIDAALAGDEAWVVQRLASIPVNEFPVVDEKGQVHVEPFYTVMGFAPTKYGLGIVGRASQKQVVNVAQRGGMCGILIGRPVGKLVGPGEPARREG